MHGAAGWVGARAWCCVWAVLWGLLLSGVAFQQVFAATQLQQGFGVPVCRGLHKVEVDWWVMLKHPRGYQYSYIDSSSVSSSAAGSCNGGACWRHGLSMQTPNPVSHTLGVLTAAAADSVAYAIYNDADPGGTEHFEFAHAKVSVMCEWAGLAVVGCGIIGWVLVIGSGYESAYCLVAP